MSRLSRMLSRVSLLGALCCMAVIPDLLEATSLAKVKDAQETAAAGSVSIDSARAHDFLSQTRPRRNVEDKWHRSTPDFQSYYRFYNSIGHIEGLYEIDRLRILYQQMRHLEQVHGADAPTYQNLLGLQTTLAPPTTTATTLPPTTTEPPPPPTTVNPLADADVYYLCNPRDALCKPQIVFLPTGAVPVLCDPRYNAACRPKSKEEIAAAAPPPPPPPPPAPKKPAAAPPPPPPPPPAVIAAKSMEYDCDPYWDPDCLVDHPPRPAQPAAAAAAAPPPPPPPPAAVAVKEKAEEAKAIQPEFDPYDYKRDLYDPYRYANAAADEE